MKKSYIVILLFLNFVGLSQEYKVPKIEFKEKRETQNAYIELLKLKDDNSLIVKIGFQSYWFNGIHSNLIVFQNDGKILRYDVFFPNDSLQKIRVKKKIVSKKAIPKYWDCLNKIIIENKLNIDNSKLNIEKVITDDRILKLSTRSDSIDESFEITQKNEFTYLSSYDSLYQIQQKNPGFEERQKLVDLINTIETLIKK